MLRERWDWSKTIQTDKQWAETHCSIKPSRAAESRSYSHHITRSSSFHIVIWCIINRKISISCFLGNGSSAKQWAVASKTKTFLRFLWRGYKREKPETHNMLIQGNSPAQSCKTTNNDWRFNLHWQYTHDYTPREVNCTSQWLSLLQQSLLFLSLHHSSFTDFSSTDLAVIQFEIWKDEPSCVNLDCFYLQRQSLGRGFLTIPQSWFRTRDVATNDITQVLYILEYFEFVLLSTSTPPHFKQKLLHF